MATGQGAAPVAGGHPLLTGALAVLINYKFKYPANPEIVSAKPPRSLEPAQRLAWSLIMNDRLGADSPALALPFDLVEECSAAVARIHRSYQPGSSIYFGDEHWITLRYEPSDHPSQPSMLLARRGHRGRSRGASDPA